jgi:hypothetical protein
MTRFNALLVNHASELARAVGRKRAEVSRLLQSSLSNRVQDEMIALNEKVGRGLEGSGWV